MTTSKLSAALAPIAIAAAAFAAGLALHQRQAPARQSGILGAGVYVPVSPNKLAGMGHPGITHPGVGHPAARWGGIGHPGGFSHPGGFMHPGGFQYPGGWTHPGGFSHPGGFTHPGGFSKP